MGCGGAYLPRQHDRAARQASRRTLRKFRCHGFPESPKDKFLVNVINAYPTEVKRHPQTLWVEDGVLRKEDLKGPVKEGSTRARLEEVEQEVFKYKSMIERGVEANYDIIAELKREHEEDMKEVRSIISTLETKVFELQGHIYALQNQNCEYELKFSCMGLAAESRILETEESCVEGGPLPWKRFTKDYLRNKNKDEE
ncbi:hypothetical protein D1007_13344 [Hordeum vulgare]|nr:hypothetical protein D1007_13344 [Hordeum vulgare]